MPWTPSVFPLAIAFAVLGDGLQKIWAMAPPVTAMGIFGRHASALPFSFSASCFLCSVGISLTIVSIISWKPIPYGANGTWGVRPDGNNLAQVSLRHYVFSQRHLPLFFRSVWPPSS